MRRGRQTGGGSTIPAGNILWLIGAFLLHATPVAAAGVPQLQVVRCLGGRDYSRLVLELSQPVEHRMQRLPASPTAPARVHLDLLGARLPPSPPPACATAGPLTRVQLAQTDRGVRLVLDVASTSAVRVFPFLDLFRLVVDVEVAAARPAPPSTPAVSARARRAPIPPRPPAEPLAAAVPFKVVIDPGHGGKDPGAIGSSGIREKDVVLAIARELRDLLQALPGVAVVLTRDDDVFLSLEERTAKANSEHADLFVSVHANASPNSERSGIETYYLNNTDDRATLRLAAMENGLASVTGRRQKDRDAALILSALIQNYKVAESAALAAAVQRGLVSTLAAQWPNIVDLGVKQGPFYVLVGAGMPCVLAEISFVTHPLEGARLGQVEYRQALAEGLMRGIRQFVDSQRAAGTL
ncbi:MAG: N-acetylmuramoyl-L-alanine amidase [Deltaproteobacteria bacterium]|nr:N-acetylmuramoyl-L-alanine amidase [Deltaproteobacteria bacterium]